MGMFDSFRGNRPEATPTPLFASLVRKQKADVTRAEAEVARLKADPTATRAQRRDAATTAHTARGGLSDMRGY